MTAENKSRRPLLEHAALQRMKQAVRYLLDAAMNGETFLDIGAALASYRDRDLKGE